MKSILRAIRMTEEEWLIAGNLTKTIRKPIYTSIHMIWHLQFRRFVSSTKQGRRNLRLVATSCGRHFWHQLDQNSRSAIEIAERYADGEISKKELKSKRQSMRYWDSNFLLTASEMATHVLENSTFSAASYLQAITLFARCGKTTLDEAAAEHCHQAEIIRDIFGNPFHKEFRKRAERFSRNDTIQVMAQRLYERKSFNSLPELKLALLQEGCRDPGILEHCDEPRHFRGCWLVDALRRGRD